MKEKSIDISLVIPLFNEEESLEELTSWITKVMKEHNFSHEIIFIDDGSTDKSWQKVLRLCDKYDAVRGIKFRRNYGKSAALNTGFKKTRGEVVITMDADLQDSPNEIPELYRLIKKEGYDIISGWKKKRHDPISKRWPSKIYNAVVRKVSGIHLHDFNCGLKSYNYEVVKNIEVYGHMHRFIPVIAKWEGFTKIGEKVVQHQARKHGYSKFGIERYVHGFLDLATVTFMGKFSKRPMHFFGAAGSLLTMLGLILLIYLTISKLFFSVVGIADRPLFYFGILAIIVGVQLFIAGFLAELISRSHRERNSYKISAVTEDSYDHLLQSSGETVY